MLGFGTYGYYLDNIPKEIFAPYIDAKVYGVEYRPKRKKLKGYQKCRK